MMAIYVYTTPHSIGYLIYTAYQHLADFGMFVLDFPTLKP